MFALVGAVLIAAVPRAQVAVEAVDGTPELGPATVDAIGPAYAPERTTAPAGTAGAVPAIAP